MHRGRNYKDKKCGNLNNNRRIERGNFGTFYTLINPWAQKLYWMDFTNLIGIHQNFYKPQEWRREPQDMRQHVSVDCPGISPITQLQFNSRLSWVLTSRDFNNDSSRSFHRARRCPLHCTLGITYPTVQTCLSKCLHCIFFLGSIHKERWQNFDNFWSP